MPPDRSQIVHITGNLRFPLIGALAGGIHESSATEMHVRDERPCTTLRGIGLIGEVTPRIAGQATSTKVAAGVNPATLASYSGSEVMPPDRSQIVEDPDTERHDRGDIKLDSQLVAEVGQARRQGRVRQQAAEEDARLERARDVGLERSEDGVQRREQRDRGVARVADRNRQRRHQAEQDAYEREQDRYDYYLHYPHQLRGFAVPGVPADSRRSRRVRGAFWRGPLICKPAPVKARVEPHLAMAKAWRVGAICNPRRARPDSSR